MANLVFMNATHIAYTYHLFNNAKKEYGKKAGKVQEHFKRAASAYTKQEFHMFMRQIKKCSNDIYGYLVYPIRDLCYQVFNGTSHYTVNLDSKTCICRKFQNDDLPCQHVLAVISSTHLDKYTQVLPLAARRGPGRPRKG